MLLAMPVTVDYLDEIHEQIISKCRQRSLISQRAKKLAGASLLGKQDNLAFLKAATTLLNALDSGAELLVVAKQRDLDMFTANFASIQKRIGREIPLPMISLNDFNTLCNSEEVVEEA